MTIVVPPPGVSSTASSPPIASTKPLAIAKPSPTPRAGAVVVDDPLERLEHQLAVDDADAGTAVDDLDVDVVSVAADLPGGDPCRRVGRRHAAGVGDEVRQRPLEQRGVGDDVRQRLVDVDVDVWGAGAEAADRRHDDFLHAGRPQIGDDRRRLQPAHVEQVADERRQPIGLRLDRRLELGPRRRAASRCRVGEGWRSTP